MTGDLKTLQGTWTVIALEVDGMKMTFGGSKIVLDGEKFTTIAMGGDYGGTVELDSKKSPKTFNLLFSTGPHQGKKSLGIYELEGDTWRICLAFAGIKNRPAEFATKPGTGFALETLKRENVSKAADSDVDAGPATEIEGEWAMVSGSLDGVAMQASLVKQGRRISKGNQLTVLFGTQVFLKGRVRLDPSQSPKHIDYVMASAGAAQLGIYELDGKKLKIAMAAAGDPRPTAFTCKKGDGRTVTVWRPAK